MATKTIKKPAKWKKLWNIRSSYFNSCSDLQETEESSEKLKWPFEILDLCLMFFLKNLNEIITES